MNINTCIKSLVVIEEVLHGKLLEVVVEQCSILSKEALYSSSLKVSMVAAEADLNSARLRVLYQD